MNDHLDPETLGAYAEGRLPERAASIEAHVASCPDCLAALAAVGAAGELARYAAPLPLSLVQRLEKIARRTPSSPRVERRRRPVSGRERGVAPEAPWARTAALLVPVAAALVVGLLVLSRTRPDERVPEGAGASPVPSPTATPSPSPSAAASPRPTPTPAPSPAETVPETPAASPSPLVTPDAPTPTAEPTLAPAASPSPLVTAARPSPAPGDSRPAEEARPVEVELAAGACTVAKKAIRSGERASLRPGDEIVATAGARLLVRGAELSLKGTAGVDETHDALDAGSRLVAVRVRSGEAVLSVPPALEGGAAFEVHAGSLRGRPEPSGRARVLCSYVGDRAVVASLEGAVKAGDGDGPLALDLASGQQVSARKGARPGKPEAARAPSWAPGLAAREVAIYAATFESDAGGWDEEVRVSPGFGGSRSALQAVPTGAGQPWRFLALRTRFAFDPARHAIRFRWRTPLPTEPLEITVQRLGIDERLVAVVRPPATKDTWTLFELRLADFKRVAGAGDSIGLGGDRLGKIVLQQGTEHDPVPADFAIDDFEVVERGP